MQPATGPVQIRLFTSTSAQTVFKIAGRVCVAVANSQRRDVIHKFFPTTQKYVMASRREADRFKRFAPLLCGAACYSNFLGTFLYSVRFIGNFFVWKSIDSSPQRC